MIILAALFAVSIQQQLEKLHGSIGDFHPIYKRLSKSLIVAAVIDDDSQGQLILYRIGPKLHEIARAELMTDPRAIELQDIDGDGRKEIFVAFPPDNRHTPHTLFRWTPTSLIEIGEAGDPQFEDLDHDGKADLVEADRCYHEDCEVSACGAVHYMRNGSFEDASLSFTDWMKWTLQNDGTQQFSIDVGRDKERAVLHLINGQRGAKHRVSKLELTLDGKPLPVPLTRDTEFLDVPVTLTSHCSEIVATLHGARGDVVTMLVELKEN